MRQALETSGEAWTARTSGVQVAGTTTEADGTAFALHDARNLLAAMVANLAYLRAVIPGSAPEALEALEVLADLDDGCARVTAMLGEALGSLTGPSMDPEVTSGEVHGESLGALVESAVTSVRRRARDAGVTVTTQGDGNSEVSTDSPRLRRVLDNLLDNALRFTPRGTTIEVSWQVDTRGAVLRVADQGKGIPEEARERVFEPYFTTGAANDDGAHVGLGLAYCRAAMRELGGSIRVYNRTGGGACFVVELPGM